jgi:dTDP-4-amino-4,6-dideoxygalactose transaminase
MRFRSDPRPAVSELLQHDYGAEHAILYGSGTQALQVALELAKRSVGGSPAVALPAFTCFDVGTAAVGSGARIVLYDVDPGTLGPDFDSLRRVVKEGARVAVVSPLYGVPVDWASVEDCIAPYGAIAIEDAAQGHGATWRGRPLGSLGPLSVLSFGRGKGWTGVRAGALLFREQLTAGVEVPRRDPNVLAELRVVMSALAQWALGRPTWYALPAAIPWLELGETRYRDPSEPERMTQSAGALLRQSFGASALEASVRRNNAQWLLDSAPLGPHVRAVQPVPDGAPGYLRLPLRLSRGMAGFPAAEKATRLGIAASYPSTLAVLPQVRAGMSRTDSRWPGAEELVCDLVTLPTHSRVTAAERAQVLHLLNAYRA